MCLMVVPLRPSAEVVAEVVAVQWLEGVAEMRSSAEGAIGTASGADGRTVSALAIAFRIARCRTASIATAVPAATAMTALCIASSREAVRTAANMSRASSGDVSRARARRDGTAAAARGGTRWGVITRGGCLVVLWCVWRVFVESG